MDGFQTKVLGIGTTMRALIMIAKLTCGRGIVLPQGCYILVMRSLLMRPLLMMARGMNREIKMVLPEASGGSVDCCFIRGAQDVTLAVTGEIWDGQVCLNKRNELGRPLIFVDNIGAGRVGPERHRLVELSKARSEGKTDVTSPPRSLLQVSAILTCPHRSNFQNDPISTFLNMLVREATSW